MKTTKILTVLSSLLVLSLYSACAYFSSPPLPPVNTASVEPGGVVTLHGEPQQLLGTPIKVGEHLPATALISAANLAEVDLSKIRGKVLFLSIVPSIDTRVCEIQTHILGEKGNRMPAGVERITISRDTPFAQERFAKEAKLTDIRFLSDYKEGDFGRSVGLLQADSRLLARAVILVDPEGVVRYIQVVPELTDLPDMERAFDQATQLAVGAK